jgi:nucleoside-diphosphate-sugar epimerase
MGMKVHVTGAGGFIGTNLLDPLRLRHQLCADVSGADAVIHLAGIAHRHAKREELDEVNVRLAERLGRQAGAAGARFIFLSTVKVHGEESAAPLNERSPIAPADPYASSKARAEDRLRAITGLRLTVLRPPLVYGPGVKANFLSLMRLIDRRWPLPLASVRNRRSLIYVGNLADAIVRSLDREGTFLVSDGPAVSTPELCRELAVALRCRARLFPWPVSLLPRKLRATLEVDDAAIRGAFAWQPPYTRQAGLRATADWYRERR